MCLDLNRLISLYACPKGDSCRFPVLQQQNELYLYCIEECRKLYQQLGVVCKTPLTPQLVVNTADKLIYNYAVEQVRQPACVSAGGCLSVCLLLVETGYLMGREFLGPRN